MSHTKSSNRGISYLELLMAMLIFSIAVAAISSTILVTTNWINGAKEHSIAVADAITMMESIKSATFDSATTLFPNGVSDGSPSNPYEDMVGGYSLINESITVTYADPNANPLEICTTINWRDNYGKVYNISMSTFKTR